jgi:phosphoglycolate phosphatase-like HAD superfamily hydrolase
MLIIFDVDGTLLGGEAEDWSAFDNALKVVLGFTPTPGFFSSLPDVTSESIVAAAMEASGHTPDRELVAAVQSAYLEFLGDRHRTDPAAFGPRNGAALLLDHLSSREGVSIAVATGDWQPTIAFKLRCSGLDLSRFAMATASEARRRAEIIALAAAKAGRAVTESVYVGDGLWDMRTCRELDIPFICTGTRTEQLLDAGAEYACADLDIATFTSLLSTLQHANRGAALDTATGGEFSGAPPPKRCE